MSLTPEQIELRRLGIFGTDASSVQCLNKYKSYHTLYQEKVGAVSDKVVPNLKMKMGHINEPANKGEYESKTGRWVATSDATIFHPDYPYLGAHMDGLSILPCPESEVIGVEFKLAFEKTESLWGSEWSDVIPVIYKAQILHYGLVTNIKRWHVCRINTRDGSHVIHDVRFTDEDFAKYLAQAKEFWRRVQEKDEPPLDGSYSTTQTVRKMYPRTSAGKIRVYNKTWGKLVSRLDKEKQKVGKAQVALDKTKNQIRVKMKDVESVVDTSGNKIITNKANKKGQRTLRFFNQ